MKIDKTYMQFIDKNIYKPKDEHKSKAAMDNPNHINIEISKSAKELVKKMEQLNDSNISEKAEKIRQSLLNGTYKVSSEEIADKMLMALELQKGESE